MIIERDGLMRVIKKINRRLMKKQVKGDIVLYNDTCLSYLKKRQEPIDQLEVLYWPKDIIDKMFTSEGREELFDSSIKNDISKGEKLELCTKLSHLSIYCQSLDYILAMKIKRAKCADLKAIEWLVRKLRIGNVSQLESLLEEFYHLNQIDERMIDEVATRFLR